MMDDEKSLAEVVSLHVMVGRQVWSKTLKKAGKLDFSRLNTEFPVFQLVHTHVILDFPNSLLVSGHPAVPTLIAYFVVSLPIKTLIWNTLEMRMTPINLS